MTSLCPCRPGHVKEFSGKALAIDAFAWLHRGAFSCALELATGQVSSPIACGGRARGQARPARRVDRAAALTGPAAPVQPTTRHIDYCLHLIGMLQHYGVRPIAVLDGAPLPVRRLQSAG